MPLEDLEPLGYTVVRAPDGVQTLEGVHGHGRQWIVAPDGDPQPGMFTEEQIVEEATHHAALYEKLTQAQDYFAGTYANWPTMTNAQKDTAMRNSQRALTNLIRHVRNDLTSEGA